MKKDTHPEYHQVTAECSCGNKLTIGTTKPGDFHLDVCSNCHPFYTGQQKLVDTSGRIEKFKRKYG